MQRNRTRRLFAWFTVFVSLYFTVSILAGIFLAEISLHLQRRPLQERSLFAAILENDFHAQLEDVSVAATDGVQLKGWYARPERFNGSTVVLLHGVTDNRTGVAGFARMFLQHGYAVLLPDARAHGESGGEIATYGVRERYDTLRWDQWIRQRTSGCVYLFGESMGAAIALETTAADPKLCAVVVESPFSQFREIAYDRIARHAHLPTWLARTVGRPMLDFALLYAQMRYKIDLTQASPEDALSHSKVPALLIHGTADNNIPIRHSYELTRTCASHARLWVVQGADHGGAVNVAHGEFETRIIGWFTNHNSVPE